MTRPRLWLDKIRLRLARLLCPRSHEVRERPRGWIHCVGDGVYQYVPMTEEEFRAN